MNIPSQPSYRPSSPTTTLKNSIANAEAKLNEKRARIRKTKNDHKVSISKIRKELDNYNHRLRSGTDENRQRQRSLQLERNIKQTTEMTAELERQLSNLESIPDHELEEWAAEKTSFENDLERLNTVKEELLSTKAGVAREIASLESDFNSTTQRRERLQGRRTRLHEQYERIVSANAQGLNERERRAAEQFARDQDHAKVEANFNDQFASIGNAIQEYQLRASQLIQRASAIDNALQHQQQQQQQMLMDPGPLTPEGNLPGTNPLPPETTGMPLTTMTTTATGSRSLLGLNYPQIKSSPLQASATPVGMATSPHPASPAQQPSYLQHVSASPYFSPDSIHRVRSFSNRSGRNVQFSSDFVDMSRVSSLQAELSSSGMGAGQGGGGVVSDSNGPFNLGFRPISSPFQRAGSRGSGSGSGNGSGSGSPASIQGKGNSS